MHQSPHRLGLLAAAGAILLVAVAAGQEERREGRAPAGENVLRVPGGEPVIQITADAPQETRAGQSFDYQIRVENVSQNIAVYDLVLVQHSPQNFEIQSSQLQEEPSRSQASQQGRQGAAKQQTRQQSQQGRSQPQQGQQRRQDQQQDRQAQRRQSQQDQASQQQRQQSGRQQGQPGDQTQDQQQRVQGQQRDQQQAQRQGQQGQRRQGRQGAQRWTIDELRPGESRTIQITAISDSEGEGNVCVAIESYQPALCLTTRFTRPDLEIVKQAPERADICDVIEVEYYVKNAGTGNLEQFTVEDRLPQGLQTIDGQSQLRFTLEDGLAAGDVRKFVARLYATRAGEFSSRASVRGPDGISAQSNRTTTRVTQPELAVALEGPSVQEADALVNYTIRVANRGDAAAPNAQLTLYFPRSADLVRQTEPRRSSGQGQPQQFEQRRRQQQQAQQQRRQQTQQQAQQQRDAQAQKSQQRRDGQRAAQEQQASQNRQQMTRRQWDLGSLEPGETIEIHYALRPYEAGRLEQIAVAEFVCPVAEEREIDREMFRAEETVTTEIISLPGLRVAVVDDNDPVATGENVTYAITVANEGDAPAHDIQVTAQLPEQLEFVQASGQTEGKHSQRQISFEPVQVLEPGESAKWQVVTKVSGRSRTAILSVELTSSALGQSVTAEEPTNLYSPDQAQSQPQEQPQGQQRQPQGQQDQELRREDQPAPKQRQREEPQQKQDDEQKQKESPDRQEEEQDAPQDKQDAPPQDS